MCNYHETGRREHDSRLRKWVGTDLIGGAHVGLVLDQELHDLCQAATIHIDSMSIQLIEVKATFMNADTMMYALPAYC